MPAVRTAKPPPGTARVLTTTPSKSAKPTKPTKPAVTPATVSATVTRAPESIVYPLAGERDGMPVTPFQWTVYDLVKQIPEGSITTYAALARALHTSPRAVGTALRSNPFCPLVPCHRVVAASGRLHGFFGKTSGHTMDTKADMLVAEGVPVVRDGEGYVIAKDAMGRVWTAEGSRVGKGK